MGKFFNQVVMPMKRIPGRRSMEQLRRDFIEQTVCSQKDTTEGIVYSPERDSKPTQSDVLSTQNRPRKAGRPRKGNSR